MAKITKKQIAEYAAANEGLSKAAAERTLDHAFAFIGDTLANGDEVVIHGFGTFKLAQRAARTGRNPATGAPIDIPASTVVKFKPTPTLKNEVK